MTQIDDVLALAVIGRDEAMITYAATIDPVYTIGPKVHGGSAQMLAANAAHAAFLEWTRSSAPPREPAGGRAPGAGGGVLYAGVRAWFGLGGPGGGVGGRPGPGVGSGGAR